MQSGNMKRGSRVLHPGAKGRIKAKCPCEIVTSHKDTSHGRSGGTRTHGLLVPNQAHYHLCHTPKRCPRIMATESRIIITEEAGGVKKIERANCMRWAPPLDSQAYFKKRPFVLA